MSSLKTVNQAFRGLNVALDLPGATNLTEIDISLASCTLDLKEMVRAGVAAHYYMRRTRNVGGAGDSVTRIDPHTPGDWTFTMRKGQNITSATATASVIPPAWEYILLAANVTGEFLTDGIWAWLAESGTMNYFPLYRVNSIVAFGSAFVGIPSFSFLPAWHGPQSDDPRVLMNLSSVSAGGNVQYALSLIAAPPGVLPVLGP